MAIFAVVLEILQVASMLVPIIEQMMGAKGEVVAPPTAEQMQVIAAHLDMHASLIKMASDLIKLHTA